MKPEHQWSPDPTVKENTITETGALCISSGSKTGRVPKEKRIVLDDTTKDVSSLPPCSVFSWQKYHSCIPKAIPLTLNNR
jgi:ATP-dependent phosphoenolpyruvate carboxykinase